MKKRNIGIMAHVDAGKTTTTERILYYTGRTHRIGNVDSGNTVMDWMTQEQERGITITAAATACYWKDIQINIIDTPGHVDFTAEVERSLRVLDGSIAIFSAVDGVEPQSETVWHQADTYNIPRLVFVNKMDRLGADFDFVVRDIQEKLGTLPAILQFPIGSEGEFEGVVDILTQKEAHWSQDDQGVNVHLKPLRETLSQKSGELYELLVDILTQNSDELLEKVLNEESISFDLIKKVLKEQTLSLQITPVFVGASLKNIGVQPLLDAIIDYLPSPLEVPEIKAYSPLKKKSIVLTPSFESDFVGFVFKVQHDSQMGYLCFTRIYQGSLKKGQRVYNAKKQKKEKVNRIFRLHANRYEPLETAEIGDIVALVGLKFTQTGDTLSQETLDYLLGEITFPQPVISMSIEAKSSTDIDNLQKALEVLSMEDPTFSYGENKETGQLLIYGMGELHLDVMIRRLQEDYNIPLRVSSPQVSYREKPTKDVDYEFQFEGMFMNKAAHLSMNLILTPLLVDQENNNFSYGDNLINKVGFFPIWQEALKKGSLNALNSGILMGYKVIGTSLQVKDILWPEEQSVNEAFFEMVGSLAVTQALRLSEPIRMQPIMKVEIRTPSEYMGDIMSQLVTKRGMIYGTETKGQIEIIQAKLPLVNLFGYATSLRSASQGRASFSMTFSHYE